MTVFLRRMAWLCVAIAALLIAGTVGFVVTEGTSVWRAFRWTLDTVATVASNLPRKSAARNISTASAVGRYS